MPMLTPLRLLIIEDSPDDAELMVIQLRRGGYDVTFRRVDTAEATCQALDQEAWDIILCDHSLPHFSSDVALRMVQERQLDTPFIIVSGTIGEEHAVKAMRAGCHDYVLKNNLNRLLISVQRELRDVQSRRNQAQAEEALQESENRLRHVVDSLPVVLLSAEAHTNRPLLVIGAVEDLLGYDKSTLLEDPQFHPSIVHPEDAPYVDKVFQEGLASGKPFDLEFRVIHGRRQQPVWLYQHVVPILAEDGSLVRHDSVVLDITHRKEAEIERGHAHHQLLQAQKLESIGVLAGGIAHDFNNLLTIISGNAQFLSHKLSLAPKDAAILKNIETAAAHATEMTRSLQAFTRPSTPQIRRTDAGFLIKEVYRLLRRMIPATIDFQLDLDTSPCTIAVDPGQMQQVIVNLCINARDAMPTGGLLRIETKVINREELPSKPDYEPDRDRYVRVRVSDSGCGMSNETLERIFDPFFTTKPKDRGTGLGLAIVYTIVRAHHGLIDVKSESGTGTQFDTFFPAIDKIADEPSAEALPSSRGQERILVVEDADMVASFLKTVLESHGYRVSVTHTPGKAIDLMKTDTSPFDLAIVDYALPEMTGDLCLTQLIELQPALKSILITGYNIDQTDLAVVRCSVLHKPFSVPAFVQLVRQVLDGN